MEKTHETFDEWMDVFIDVCLSMGYTGNIDKDTFESHYLNGNCPYDIAENFINKLNDFN